MCCHLLKHEVATTLMPLEPHKAVMLSSTGHRNTQTHSKLLSDSHVCDRCKESFGGSTWRILQLAASSSRLFHKLTLSIFKLPEKNLHTANVCCKQAECCTAMCPVWSGADLMHWLHWHEHLYYKGSTPVVSRPHKASKHMR